MCPRSGPDAGGVAPCSAQIIIGTHGKIKSWVSKRLLSFGCMQLMVFDEADEMLKGDGFADDSLRLIKGIKKQSASCQVPPAPPPPSCLPYPPPPPPPPLLSASPGRGTSRAHTPAAASFLRSYLHV